MNDYPAEGPGPTTVTAERDDQGWWAVRASVETARETVTLTCTAIPVEGGGARAASWSVDYSEE